MYLHAYTDPQNPINAPVRYLNGYVRESYYLHTLYTVLKCIIFVPRVYVPYNGELWNDVNLAFDDYFHNLSYTRWYTTNIRSHYVPIPRKVRRGTVLSRVFGTYKLFLYTVVSETRLGKLILPPPSFEWEILLAPKIPTEPYDRLFAKNYGRILRITAYRWNFFYFTRIRSKSPLAVTRSSNDCNTNTRIY